MLPNEIDDNDSNDFFDVDEEEEDEEQVNWDLLLFASFQKYMHVFFKINESLSSTANSTFRLDNRLYNTN